jgi:hypothetical protein
VCNTPLVGLLKVEYDPYRNVASVIVAIAGIALPTEPPRSVCTVFAEFAFGSLRSGISIGNEISAAGAKALGDALKDNSTLASLSLTLSSA